MNNATFAASASASESASRYASPSKKMYWESASLARDLLPLCDFISLLLAGYVTTLIGAMWFPLAGLTQSPWSGIESIALLAAILAPLILCDRGFGLAVDRDRTAALLRCYATRFVMFVGVVLVLGAASHALARLRPGWGVTWLASSLVLTSLSRLLLVRHTRSLKTRGLLKQVIAVVGAGPMAGRLIQHLALTRPGTAEILGVFDERPECLKRSENLDCEAAGTIEALVEMGTRRKIDLIVVCLPGSEPRLPALVHRLKALAAPIGLCPASIGLTLSGQVVDYVGDQFPVTLLADAPARARGPGLDAFLPR